MAVANFSIVSILVSIVPALLSVETTKERFPGKSVAPKNHPKNQWSIWCWGLDLLMKGDMIPDPHNIARLCNPKHIDDGVIQPTAFRLRVGEENLSVDWLEFLNRSSRGNEITELRHIYAGKFKVSTRARIGILNVGQMRKKVRQESPDRRNLNVRHNPEFNDQAHSGIYDLKQDDEMIAELILESVLETYSAHG